MGQCRQWPVATGSTMTAPLVTAVTVTVTARRGGHQLAVPLSGRGWATGTECASEVSRLGPYPTVTESAQTQDLGPAGIRNQEPLAACQ